MTRRRLTGSLIGDLIPDGASSSISYFNLLTDLTPDVNLDFSDTASLSITTNLVNSVTNTGALGAEMTLAATGATRPTYDATFKRAIFGSGNSLGVGSPSVFNSTGNLSLFIVFMRSADSGAAESMFAQYRASTNDKSFSFGFSSSDELQAVLSADGTADVVKTLSGSAVQINDVNILSFVNDVTGNTSRLSLGGDADYTLNDTAVNLRNSSTAVGINFINNAVATFQGSIFQIVAYNTALSATNRQKVEAHLATKWDNILDDFIEGA